MLRSLALVAVAASVAALAPGRVARAAEIEYAVVYRVLAAARDVARYPRLRAVQRVESKRADVPPNRIGLSLRTRAGSVEIPVADDGTVALPVDEALLAEHCVVVTNQPAGSLTLTLSIELGQPDGAILDGAEIEAARAAADAVLAAQHAGARVRGVEFRFAPGEQAAVTLRGVGERMLVPDHEGRVIVMRDADLAAHDAQIELSARPVRILPFLDR
jgi:hypothetical protein